MFLRFVVYTKKTAVGLDEIARIIIYVATCTKDWTL